MAKKCMNPQSGSTEAFQKRNSSIFSENASDCNPEIESGATRKRGYMGRKKIDIVLIEDAKTRMVHIHVVLVCFDACQITFSKRWKGLTKTAKELSILCDCRIGIIAIDANGTVHQYASHELDEIITKYLQHDEFIEIVEPDSVNEDSLKNGQVSQNVF